MKSLGIIVEYNPFHNGHAYHLKQAKDLTHPEIVIAAMSGDWTQRGEPAVLDKWARAAYAVTEGVDLVLDLPYIYATQQADYFAYGAVRTLQLAGAEAIAFGSECGSLSELLAISEIPFDPTRFRENLDAGCSYPKSYSSFSDPYGPNDILALSYLREMKKYGIRPLAIRRTVNYYDEHLAKIASAQAIRKAIREGKDVSLATGMAPQLSQIPGWDDYYPYLRTLLMTAPAKELSERLLVSEGIENHLIRQARANAGYQGFIQGCVTRRYTKSRIQRTLVQILTQTTKQERDALPELNFCRVLALNERGRRYLAQRRHSGAVIANKFMQIPKRYRELELKAAAAYALPFAGEKRERIIEQEVYGIYR